MWTRRSLLLSVLFILSSRALAQSSSPPNYIVVGQDNYYSHPIPSGWKAVIIPEGIGTNIYPQGEEGIALVGDCDGTSKSIEAKAKSIDNFLRTKNLPRMKRLSRTAFVTKGGVKGIRIVYVRYTPKVYASYNRANSWHTVYIFPAKNHYLITFEFRQTPSNVEYDLTPYDPAIDAATVDAVMRSLKLY